MRKVTLNVKYSLDGLVVLLVLTLLFTVPRAQPVAVTNWRMQTDWLRTAGLNAVGSSNVTFFVSPALQVNITFNGRNYTNGQSDFFLNGNYNATAKLSKSLTTPPPPPSSCPPGTYYTSIWEFHEWTANGSLAIQGNISSNPVAITVTGSGNLTANLIRGYIGCPADIFAPEIVPLFMMGILLSAVARFRRKVGSLDVNCRGGGDN